MKEARDKSGDDDDLAFNLDLVRARILTRWKGHDGEALALLDTLAEVRPCIRTAHTLLQACMPTWGAVFARATIGSTFAYADSSNT